MVETMSTNKEIPENMKRLRALLQETIKDDPLKHSYYNDGIFLEHKITGRILNSKTDVELTSFEGGIDDGRIIISCEWPENLKISLYLGPNPKEPITVTSNYRLTKDGPKVTGFKPYILYPNKVQNGDGETLYYLNRAKSAATEYLEGRLQITNPPKS